MMETKLRDRFGRAIEYLRVSVTERCNMRCVYCVSPDDRASMPREHLLEFEEIATIVRALTPQGLRRIRLTGGEPLVRPHLPDLVHMLAQIPGVEDLSLRGFSYPAMSTRSSATG
jgi:cyclic pyranopterin phosphate synthase